MTMNNIRRRTIEIIIIIGCIFIGASLLQNIEASAEARVISTHHNVFEVKMSQFDALYPTKHLL